MYKYWVRRMVEEEIRRLVDKDPGRYSDFMTLFHRANSRPLDVPSQSRSDSRLMTDCHFRPVPQISAAR